MPDLEDILIKLRNALGYEEDLKGICVLYSEKGIDAWLGGRADYTRFKQRNYYIVEQHEHLLEMIKSVKDKIKMRYAEQSKIEKRPINVDISAEESKLFEVACFIEQGELYQHPGEYTHLFGRPLSQFHVIEIAKYAESATLKQCGGKVQLGAYPGIYSLNEFKKYIATLDTIAKLYAQDDFALSLKSHDHGIAFCYHHNNKSWTVIDSHQPDLPPIHIEKQNDLDSVTNNIFLSLADDETKTIGLYNKIFSTGNHQKKIQDFVDQLEKDKTFNALHQITPEHVNRTATEGFSLLDLAARDNDIAVLKQIAETNFSFCKLFSSDVRIFNIANKYHHQPTILFLTAWEKRNSLLARANRLLRQSPSPTETERLETLKNKILNSFRENHQLFLHPGCFRMDFFRKINHDPQSTVNSSSTLFAEKPAGMSEDAPRARNISINSRPC